MTVSALAQEQKVNDREQLTDTIWSPLTELETNTLRNAPLAKSGDPDALLALAIMASGDSRTDKEFKQISSKIFQFIARLKHRLSVQKNTRLKGFELHTAMHDEFFLANPQNADLQGYRANQSQLSRIFSEKTYNCISSSMLFLVLARYFDLQVEGVVLPSHSFVQLTTPEGRVIEIETTSKTGYGIRHDAAFYASDNQLDQDPYKVSNWFKLRDLAPATYEDYLKRKIVSPYRLIVDNMNHQHTAQDRMSQADRYRLQEARGWLLPDDPEARLFRFYVINNELIRLGQHNQMNEETKLITLAENLIASYKQDSPSRNLDSGAKLDNRTYPVITYIYTRKANIAFEAGDYIGAIDSFYEALKWTGDQARAAKIVQNLTIAHVNQANKFSRKKEFTSALSWYEKAYAILENKPVIAAKRNTEVEELSGQIESNIGSLFWNMAVPYLNNGDVYAAYDLLKQCTNLYPHIQKCQLGMKQVCQTYSLPSCS